MTEVGEKAADFSLYDQDRKLRGLSEFLSGHGVVIAFFPGAFTGVCTKEMCAFRDMHGDLQKLGGSVVGISVDSPFALKGFAEVNHLNFTLLSDFDRQTIQKYGVTWRGLGGVEGYVSANRAIFVTDAHGVVRYRWVADNPGVFPNMDEVKSALERQ